MIILIAGSTHAGKTLFAQKLLCGKDYVEVHLKDHQSGRKPVRRKTNNL